MNSVVNNLNFGFIMDKNICEVQIFLLNKSYRNLRDHNSLIPPQPYPELNDSGSIIIRHLSKLDFSTSKER